MLVRSQLQQIRYAMTTNRWTKSRENFVFQKTQNTIKKLANTQYISFTDITRIFTKQQIQLIISELHRHVYMLQSSVMYKYSCDLRILCGAAIEPINNTSKYNSIIDKMKRTTKQIVSYTNIMNSLKNLLTK